MLSVGLDVDMGEAALRAGRVVVVGSANVDLTAGVDALPRPGQTVIASRLERRCGGKGANQAAAAARLGARVHLVAAVGDDEAGVSVRAAAEAAGVETGHLQTVGTATGTALITVDTAGENSIVVVRGANAELRPDHLASALAVTGARDVVVVSLEIEAGVAAEALRASRERGATTVLNPSPFSDAVGGLLAWTDVLILNEGEAAEVGAGALERPELSVIVTRGANGARIRSAGQGTWSLVPAPTVTVVDTTGCGDAFAGAVAAELAAGADLAAAAELAVRYAALAATLPGAMSSYVDRAALMNRTPGSRSLANSEPNLSEA